jgi:hypothetical protein
MLTNETITFGKYKGSTITQVLRDRNYCMWLLEQDWFQTSYEWLYNRIKDYNPRDYLIKPDTSENPTTDFMEYYTYFNLKSPEELEIQLSTVDLTCYEYYLQIISEIKDKIFQRLENDEENPYDIKAPTNWLNRFEKECGIQRQDFKDFLNAYELPNITYIIEKIKKEGGIEYKGACSFKIAKARSREQELWWEHILKNAYGEQLGSQYKYGNCIFDFICIPTKTIFECKLGLKDFDETQHSKYRIALSEYRIIYLIDRDCVVYMEKKTIYTTSFEKYKLYLYQIPMMSSTSYLDELIKNFDVVIVEDLSTLFGK